MRTIDPTLSSTLDAVLTWSRNREYAGYSKHDALNSPFLSACSLQQPLLRLIITQGVMRFPVNIRPLLGVPTGRNPKGIGLFAYAYLDLAERATNDEERAVCVQEAASLLSWLIAHAAPNAPASNALCETFSTVRELDGTPTLNGMGWGYHYPWQDQGFFQPRHYPNRVVTSWIGFAFLRAYEVTGELRFLDACEDIAIFLTDNPRVLYEDPDQRCLSYVPVEDINWAVMDVSALVAAFLARYLAAREKAGKPSSDQATQFHSMARRLMAFVVDKQTDYGAWFYTWPANDSHIKHDNYHTAIILDCLADFMTYSNDHRWESPYRRGVDYYQRALFLENGAPRWMNDRTYPHDIHGAASGILCFVRAAEYFQETAGPLLEWADIILEWTLQHLYDPRGYFRYQRTRWFTKSYCLMRWGNAWMARALAQRLRIKSH